eukprot:Awhi_evm1s3286
MKKSNINDRIALVCLVTGVGLVQYSANAGKSSANTDGDTFIGLIAVCCACLTSGFSGTLTSSGEAVGRF